MPADMFRHSATTSIPTGSVWSQLQDPEKWKAMGGIDRIRSSKVNEDGLLEGFEFTSLIGGMQYRGIATTIAAEPGRQMVVDVDTSELVARLTVDLVEIDNPGTRLDVSMRLSSKSFLASMMWGAISATVGSGLPQRVAEMVDAFE